MRGVISEEKILFRVIINIKKNKNNTPAFTHFAAGYREGLNPLTPVLNIITLRWNLDYFYCSKHASQTFFL